MAFDKAKVLKAAEKFLSQGKIEAAIKEYRQIVEHDEDDYTTLNMLGDLCVRANKKDEAIACFTRIAEHYRDQEFTLKSIAMYKKVERLKPRDPEIAKNLGALYATQGLVVDARAQFLIVADFYTRMGQTKEALEVLRDIADLDPQNTEIRLKLANGFLHEGLTTEATEAFKEAAARLYEIGAFEQSLSACAKALELNSYDQEALAANVSAHVALGTADEAAELLERIVADRPEDIELISMLAGAYISAEDAKGAERATGMLMALDASEYIRLIPVAQLYLKADQIDEVVRILESIIEQMLAGREENDLLELVNEVLARNPEHVKALRLLVRVHWWQRDMDKLRASLERLAEAAQAADLVEEERYALTQLLRLAPEDPQYTARLAELGGLQEETLEDSVFASEQRASDVPSFEDSIPQIAELPEETQFGEFETNSVAESVLTDPNSSFADLNDGFADHGASEHSSSDNSAVEFDFSEATTATRAVGEDGTSDKSRQESMMRQELESVDFYLSQGYFDIALDTLNMLEGQFGRHVEIDARRERLKSASRTAAQPVVSFGETQLPGEQSNDHVVAFEFQGTVPATENPSVVAPDSTTTAPGIDSGLAEIFEEFKEAAEGESESGGDYETHYNMGTAYKEMDLLDQAIQEFQIAASLSNPGDDTPRYLQCCNMLGHCFAEKEMPRAALLWFKKGLEAPGHTEAEYIALRYELGSAYEQLGDIHRALDLFTEVYGVDVSYRGVAEKIDQLQQQKAASKGKKKKGK